MVQPLGCPATCLRALKLSYSSAVAIHPAMVQIEHILMMKNSALVILALSLTALAQQPLILNEILVENETGIEDGNGNRNDWIEIRNPNGSVVELEGYYLTDDSSNLIKWAFPDVSIPANGYRIVFASGNDATDSAGNPHTNFRLNSAGEFLALVKPNGTTIDDQFAPEYIPQFPDISYGREFTGANFGFFTNPSPGSLNGIGADGVVRDTEFNFNRGFYDETFNLEITSQTPDVEIRFTTDGSLPTTNSGIIYSGPIEISTTSNIRALAHLPGTNWVPTNVDTHSYIFLDDVEQQPANPAGWATNWGYDNQVDQNDGGGNGIVPSDYEMDPRVVNDVANLRAPEYSIRNALLDIPSVSVTMKQTDFVNTSGQSLYGTPRSRFERVCSVEYILPDDTKGFQEDCKIETHGNSSRTPWRMQKHSLRLTFSSSVGIGKLRYNLFPDSPVNEFNKLVLRACFTDSWALNSWSSARYRPNDSQYLRDVFMKDMMTHMGHASGHGNFVHLYVNGLYFGLHNLTERIEGDWYSSHIGGEEEDWEINKDLEAPGPRWNQMRNVLNGAIETQAVYENAKNYLDLENYADYLALHFFSDAEDWPHHNGYAAANANSGDGKFRFQVWDQEIAFDKFTWNRYDDSRGGGSPFQRLRRNADFRMLFADRVYQHMFDGGTFTQETASALYMRRANEIDKAIVAESARWGDVQASTPYGNTASSSTNILSDHYPPLLNNPIYFTREQHWVTERDNIVNDYLATLHDQTNTRSFIRELQAEDLYPSIDPPNYSQLGGVVPMAYQLTLTADEGGVYFTTDGSDPRLPGGGISETAGSFGAPSIIPVFDFESTGWSYLDTGDAQSTSDITSGHPSYDATDWKHPDFDDSSWGTGQAMLGYGAINGSTINTTVEAGSLFSRTPTLYLRKSFTVTDADQLISLDIESIQDDGIIVFLNGHELFRHNMAGGSISYGDFATTADSPEGLTLANSYDLLPGQLIEGENIIAVQVHNESSTNSDLGFDLKLNALKAAAAGNSITLTESGTVLTRARTTVGEWSALRRADFIVGIPASAENVVISEIMFNPQGPDAGREYLEIMNISATDTVDFTDAAFTDGVLYQFPTGFILAPGARAVIVQDEAAFTENYSTNSITILPRAFENNLSNGGEEIVLTANDGQAIKSFAYLADDSVAGWPTMADGLGKSMELINPAANPDHGIAASWRASSAIGGSPGTGTGLPLPNNPEEDLDVDGLSSLAEYFYGTSDNENTILPLEVLAENGNVILAFPRNPEAIEATYTIEVSHDLQTWTSDPASYTLQAEQILPDGRIRETAILNPGASKKFLRLVISAIQ